MFSSYFLNNNKVLIFIEHLLDWFVCVIGICLSDNSITQSEEELLHDGHRSQKAQQEPLGASNATSEKLCKHKQMHANITLIYFLD